jgi:hypothetical protein
MSATTRSDKGEGEGEDEDGCATDGGEFARGRRPKSRKGFEIQELDAGLGCVMYWPCCNPPPLKGQNAIVAKEGREKRDQWHNPCPCIPILSRASHQRISPHKSENGGKRGETHLGNLRLELLGGGRRCSLWLGWSWECIAVAFTTASAPCLPDHGRRKVLPRVVALGPTLPIRNSRQVASAQ